MATHKYMHTHTHELSLSLSLSLTHCDNCSKGVVSKDDIPPCGHCFVHYPQLTRFFGVLKWFWLMAFERFNKLMKNLVGNKDHPLASLANALKRMSGLF